MFERWILMGFLDILPFDILIASNFWWLFQQVSSYILFPMVKMGLLTGHVDMICCMVELPLPGGPFRVETFHHVRHDSMMPFSRFSLGKTEMIFSLQNMSDFQIS